MSETHIVIQGEHLSQIATKYGFRNYLTIWDDANNADLKQLRQDPNILFPGDSVFIPDKEAKEVARGTALRHVFRVDVPKLELRIALLDWCEKPLAGISCALDVAGNISPLTTDGDGVIRNGIDSGAKQGAVRVESLALDVAIEIGSLDPVKEDSGFQARLINLAYDAGPLGFDNAMELRSAIEEFQCDHGLKVSGIFDAATKDKLREVYGC